MYEHAEHPKPMARFLGKKEDITGKIHEMYDSSSYPISSALIGVLHFPQ